MMGPRSAFAPLSLLLFALLACKMSKTDASTDGGAGSSPPAASATSTSVRYVSERDLERVCRGEPLPQAKAYDATRAGIHPALVLVAKSEGSFFEKLDDKSLQAWKTEENRDYELVLCVTTKATTTVKTCNLETSEGESRHLQLQDASYDMVLYEAKTARQIEKKSIDLKVIRQCPSGWVFRHAGDQKRPDFLPALTSWAKRHVEPRGK